MVSALNHSLRYALVQSNSGNRKLTRLPSRICNRELSEIRTGACDACTISRVTQRSITCEGQRQGRMLRTRVNSLLEALSKPNRPRIHISVCPEPVEGLLFLECKSPSTGSGQTEGDLFLVKQPSQLALRRAQLIALRRRQRLACAILVKRQHRHCRAERRRLPSMTFLR